MELYPKYLKHFSEIKGQRAYMINRYDILPHIPNKERIYMKVHCQKLPDYLWDFLILVGLYVLKPDTFSKKKKKT